jgi:hypothetical protein
MIKNIRKARYEARVMDFMQERHGDKYQLMLGFAKNSKAFVALRDKIINHYYGQRQAGVVFCVEALVLLVDRVLETMEHDVQSAQAA